MSCALARLSVTQSGLSYTSQKFVKKDYFYLAANADMSGWSAAKKTTALARVCTKADSSSGDSVLQLLPLVPATAYVNGATSLTTNPLNGERLKILSSYGFLPIVAYGEDGESSNPINIALLSDSTTGNVVVKNLAELNDAAGSATGAVKAITAGSRIHRESIALQDGTILPRDVVFNHVIAAVTPNGSADFSGAAGTGIAVLRVSDTGLVPMDATGQTVGNKAAALLDALVQINSAGNITGVNDVYWDPIMQRLFIALQLDANGGVGVVVGHLSAPSSTQKADEQKITLTLKSIISDENDANLDAAWDTNDHVLAMKAATAIEVFKVRTMHASTRTSYVIINGGTESNQTSSVYAMPIVRPAETGDGASEFNVGRLAKKTDFSLRAVEGKNAQLYVKTEDPVLVGGGEAPDAIVDMRVVGDSVFIAVAHASDSSKQGIFSSTALFDSTGKISRWSSWERVMGAADRIFGFGIDSEASYWYHTVSAGTDQDTVKVTEWGKGDKNGLLGGTTSDATKGLVFQLNNTFSRTSGMIHAFASFPKTIAHLDMSSLLVALGRDTLALALTETNNDAITGDFTAGGGKYFQAFDLTSLDLGMLTCAELFRPVTASNNGWLFVGGDRGVAVLSQASGAGWNALSDLTALSTYSFKEIGGFTNVRALQADATNMYVLTLDGLYKCAVDLNKFKDSSPTALGASLIATPTVLLGASNHSFLGFKLVGGNAFLATTGGLFTLDGVSITSVVNQLGSGGWKEVYLDAVSTPKVGFGVCADMNFISSATAGKGSNLYLLSADVSLNVGVVYRVDITTSDTAASMAPIVQNDGTNQWSYFTILGKLREYFYTNGMFGYDTGSFHHVFDAQGELTITRSEFEQLRVLPVDQYMTTIDRWFLYAQNSDDVGLGISTKADHTIGKVVRDAGSSALFVPGVWGVRIQQ